MQVVGDGSKVREGASMKDVYVLEGSCSNGYSILVDRCVTFSFIFALFMPPKELWEAYSYRTARPSVCPSVCPSVSLSVPLRVPSISPIFFEVGIPNLVRECILG